MNESKKDSLSVFSVLGSKAALELFDNQHFIAEVPKLFPCRPKQKNTEIAAFFISFVKNVNHMPVWVIVCVPVIIDCMQGFKWKSPLCQLNKKECNFKTGTGTKWWQQMYFITVCELCLNYCETKIFIDDFNYWIDFNWNFVNLPQQKIIEISLSIYICK